MQDEITKRLETIEQKVDSIDDTLRIAEYWRIGNGTVKGSAEHRLQWIENNMVTHAQIHDIIRSTVRTIRKEEKRENTTDWNKWINTLLLVVTAVGILYSIFGG